MSVAFRQCLSSSIRWLGSVHIEKLRCGKETCLDVKSSTIACFHHTPEQLPCNSIKTKEKVCKIIEVNSPRICQDTILAAISLFIGAQIWSWNVKPKNTFNFQSAYLVFQINVQAVFHCAKNLLRSVESYKPNNYVYTNFESSQNYCFW